MFATFRLSKLTIISTAIILLYSCKSSRQGLFGKKTAHERYGAALESAGLHTTTMGRLWFTAADKGLAQPLRITVPYKETGYFPADRPASAGYRFAAKRGEKIVISITTTPAAGVLFFTELWKPGTGTEKSTLLEIVDTLVRRLEYEVENDTSFLLRLQPELLKGVEYTLTIALQSSLAFPVQASGNPKVISLWGAARDGGARDHEGVDISATFRTPVVAAADGRVTRVNENNLGGKVIFMNPAGKDFNLYYAHLDSQIVTQGQLVKRGDVLGLLGKTGNARTTIPHLHFGIYASGGAIDPIAFIDREKPQPALVTASTESLNKMARTKSAATIYDHPSSNASTITKLEANQVLQILSATRNWYKIRLPDNREGFVSSDVVVTTTMNNLKVRNAARLLDAPSVTAPAQSIIDSGSTIAVKGKYLNYYLVTHNNKDGWIIQQ